MKRLLQRVGLARSVLTEVFVHPEHKLKAKISVKVHFIDDSNEYIFIYYVLGSSSRERKFSLRAGFLICFPRKLEMG